VYPVVLFAHSWLRWVVLVLGIALLVSTGRAWLTGRGWESREERLGVAFLRALDLQVILGLTLYLFLSPFSRAGFADMGAAIANPILRFYSIEHVAGMLTAVVAAHLGLERSRRLDPHRRSRTVTLTQIVWLVVTLASIPWPGLDYGRPFFRS
jgi:hypothetical protein